MNTLELEDRPKKKKVNMWMISTVILGLITLCTCTFIAIEVYMLGRLDISREDLLYLFSGVSSNEINQIADDNGLALDDKGKRLLRYIKAYYADDIDYDKMKESMYIGLVDGLDDKYSYYMTKEQYESMLADSNGQFAGIGIKMQFDYTTGITKVITVYKDGPADKAGMKAGDIFYKVDGEDVSGWTSEDLVSHVRGEKGTDVDVVVIRDKKEVELHITRDDVIVEEVTSKKLNNNTGYIKLNEFNGKAAEQMHKVADEFKQAGIKNIIMDLRNNPGGNVQVLEDMSDIFFEKGVLAEIKGKSTVTTETIYSNGKNYDFNVICLVNENSASASEMFSGAMSVLNDTILIGKKTFGKGIAQMISELEDGSAIKLTIGKYYLPDGKCIHEVGINPTIEMEQKEDVENIEDDALVQKAVSLFNDGIYTVTEYNNK